MSAPAALPATFCGFRSVGSRKVVALTFEVPVEYSERALKMLGHPDAVNPKWFAIALLDERAAALAQGASAPVPNQSSPVNTREKRDFKSLPLSQQAALACDREAFRRFLVERHADAFGWVGPIETADQAAGFVRQWCRVVSRADLDTSTYSGGVWKALYGEFEAWMRAAV